MNVLLAEFICVWCRVRWLAPRGETPVPYVCPNCHNYDGRLPTDWNHR